MPHRRAVLSGVVGLGGTLAAGCLSGGFSEPSATSGTCSAVDPPNPSDEDAKPYPAEPSELSAAAVERFVADYERAYRYNDALAANPDLVGRTNEITVEIESVTADRRGGGFAVEVTGVWESDFLDPTPPSETPETPTRTPLSAGHGSFETRYAVSDGRVEREGVTVECW